MNNKMQNVSVLRSKCYARGVSMYNANTLEPKPLKRIYKECSNNATNFTNASWRNYGVPPKSERARAIREANPGMSVKDALMLAADPFFSFKKLRYMAEEPLPGRPNTRSRSYGHNVWNIMPSYFPGPNKPSNVKTKMKPPLSKPPPKEKRVYRRSKVTTPRKPYGRRR